MWLARARGERTRIQDKRSIFQDAKSAMGHGAGEADLVRYRPLHPLLDVERKCGRPDRRTFQTSATPPADSSDFTVPLAERRQGVSDSQDRNAGPTRRRNNFCSIPGCHRRGQRRDDRITRKSVRVRSSRPVKTLDIREMTRAIAKPHMRLFEWAELLRRA